MSYQSGKHFLQIPGPTNVPDRVFRAMSKPTIDHRGPEFVNLTREILNGLKQIIRTSGTVVIYPSSGTGAWEASLVNTLSPGDKILMFETGFFATQWKSVIESKLIEDKKQTIKAVAIVHNETSTGTTSRVADVRKAMDRAQHPALLMVDTISSLASIDYRQDEWGIDVTIGCSQKGLMLPPGLGLNGISEKALASSKSARLPKSYWDWEPMIHSNKSGFFPYTPATNLLYGLSESIHMLMEEGLDNVFARHKRLGEATRLAIRAWELELLCQNPEEYSSSLTAVLMGKVFRIGHLGDFNELMLVGTLGGIEMGLAMAKIPFSKGGLMAALDYLAYS